ncbi:MAG TPA: VOC family protein [Chitinophagaceae bacterium]|nr:VOC family protein [Chitinophagaceae bacterium]
MNLNQVTIPVSDVARSISFYEKLGLKLIVSASHYARFECPAGDSTFSLHQNADAQKGSGSWIYFEVPDLDNYVQQLLDRGIKFEELPNDKTWLWRESRLKDPDNHQLIIYFAGENRKYPPWRTK